MVCLPISPSSRGGHFLSPDPPSSPEFADLNTFILDFDPISEWLVDPDPDLSPMEAPGEPAAPITDGIDPTPARLLSPDELLSQSIEEQMEKASLVNTSEHIDDDEPLIVSDKCGAFTDSIVRAGEDRDGIDSVSYPIKTAHESGEEEEEEESSESETDDESEDDSSSSVQSSSSSSEEEDGVSGGEGKADDADRRIKGGKKYRRIEEMEEGEIRDLVQDEVEIFSDEDFEVLATPKKSKHETEDLPPVPQVEASLGSNHQTLPVGVISSILGTRIIVEGSEKHTPLDEGSIVWITETRLPLGLVDEIFGPVKSPYYIVRYNSEKEVPAGISVGTAVSFVKEFSNCILNEKDLYKKGYDASCEDDEVTDEVEFSDDEKEAEYRRYLRQSKRGANDMRHRDQGSPADKMANSKCSQSSSKLHKNRDFSIDKRTTKFKGRPMNGSHQNGNRDSATVKTNFGSAAASERWHGNRESGIDNRTNIRGAMTQNYMQQVMPNSHGQPVHFVPAPQHVQLAAANFTCGNFTPMVGSGNAFGNTPVLPPAMLEPIQYGYPAQLQHKGVQEVQTNSLPSQQFIPNLEQLANIQRVQMNSFNQLQPNQAFNSFPNTMPFQQQFISNVGLPANMLLLGGPLNPSFGRTSALGQFTAYQAPIGYCNMPGQGASAQNGGQPPYSMVQSNICPRVQFNPSTAPGLLGPQGQSNATRALVGNSKMQEQGVSDSCNAQSFGQPPSSHQDGIHPVLQPNQSFGPVMFKQGGQNSISQTPSRCSNLSVQGVPGSCNADSPVQPHAAINKLRIRSMQPDPSIFPTSLGSLGQSSINEAPSGYSIMQEQGPSGLCTTGQPPPGFNQQGMNPPMRLNSFNGPESTQSAGQSGIGQVQFGCTSMDQGSSGSCNTQNYGQPPASNDQGMMCPPIQFNPGRSYSSSRGRNHYQRGRPPFKRGGRWKNG